MPKKIKPFFILLLLIGCVLFPQTVHAASSEESYASEHIDWQNTDTGYSVLLEDDAELLTPEERARLMEEMQTITLYGNVAFKSISYNSYSTSSYAGDFYHDTFGQNSGTLFLIDMDNREIYIFSDGSVYKTITNSYANSITDNVYKYASRGEYYDCASNAFAQIHSLLAGRKIAQPMKYISNALLALILAALFNYFLARRLSISSKPSSNEVLSAITTKYAFSDPSMWKTGQEKVYSPPSSSGGGGHSGGGGGGGHSSGGGGGHRF